MGWIWVIPNLFSGLSDRTKPRCGRGSAGRQLTALCTAFPSRGPPASAAAQPHNTNKRGTGAQNKPNKPMMNHQNLFPAIALECSSCSKKDIFTFRPIPATPGWQRTQPNSRKKDNLALGSYFAAGDDSAQIFGERGRRSGFCCWQVKP